MTDQPTRSDSPEPTPHQVSSAGDVRPQADPAGDSTAAPVVGAAPNLRGESAPVAEEAAVPPAVSDGVPVALGTADDAAPPTANDRVPAALGTTDADVPAADSNGVPTAQGPAHPTSGGEQAPSSGAEPAGVTEDRPAEAAVEGDVVVQEEGVSAEVQTQAPDLETATPDAQTATPDVETAAPETDAQTPTPDVETAAPETDAQTPTPDVETAAPEADAQTPTPADTAAETGGASAAPTPRPAPGPRPRPLPRPVPSPAAVVPVAAQPAVTPPVDPRDAAEAAAWGRVDDDGTVWVREASGERSVGQYTGADTEEALGFYVRRFLDLQAQVALFEARLPQLAPKEIEQTLTTLTEALEAPAAVGDIDGLRARLERLRGVAEERRQEAAAEREAARAKAVAERTAIVEKAEQIAEQDPARTQWKQSGQRLRDLLDEWKDAQRNGPRLDRSTEDKLWKRFSHARTAFDRHRRQYFSDLDASQGAVKEAKEKLIARAEELSTSTDWGRTASAYRELMDEWKAAGRASRKDDDALWARFRAAQQRFFDARSAQNAEVDAEYGENLKVKLALLEQAEALLPVSDPRTARAALRPIQDQWDEAGKVPRADVQRVEARMRAVEQAVRDAEQAEWERSNPETRARAEGAAAQLHSAIEQLEADLEQARAGGDEKQVAEAEAALEARRAWLDQIQRAAQG
ncbi:DUF349 domain-containing protein [Georgenia daeguensis]|uniref:DUF349 domain-containing protein n=1 Tax=Georgenia daeguensis TaxID=908355 RepID=A0ABP8EPU1_9MICO